jgi:hypothetical protein
MKPITSKLPPRPEAIRDPATGRVTYAGSLTHTPKKAVPEKPIVEEKPSPDPEPTVSEPRILTTKQKFDLLSALQRGEETPNSLVEKIEGLDPLNSRDLENVQRWMTHWEQDGKIKRIKDAEGKLVGWMARPDEDIE